MTINERVKLVRNTLKLTQKEFGEKITLAQTYLSQIEKGDRDVTEKIFKIICLEFNVREDWLRDGTGEMFIENDDSVISELASQFQLEEMDREILKIFLNLSPTQREAFKSFAFSLVNTVLNNEKLYQEYRTEHLQKNTLPFAARGGDASNLMEAAELYDEADKGD